MTELHRLPSPYIVAFVLASVPLVACGGPARQPHKPAPETESKSVESKKAVASPTPSVEAKPQVIGWYCPSSAAGRPGVQLLMQRDPSWSADPRSLQASVSSRRVKRFSVMAWDGRRAGSFSVAGAGRAGGKELAVGSYQGASPCAQAADFGESAEEDQACVRATEGCALAIGELEAAGGFQSRPYEEDPDTESHASGAACERDEVLVVDMDGDHVAEHFSLSSLDDAQVAGSELAYLPQASASCEASFAAPGASASSLARMAVIDLDGDGRPEILFRRGDEFLLFGAPNNPARLELLQRAQLTVVSP